MEQPNCLIWVELCSLLFQTTALASEEVDQLGDEMEEPELDTPDAREKFYQEVWRIILHQPCNSLLLGSLSKFAK